MIKQVSDFGFKQVYGNFRADIDKWNERAEYQRGYLVVLLHHGLQQLNLISERISLLIFWDVQIFYGQNKYLPVDKLALITDALD